jgi:hypothetical protein
VEFPRVKPLVEAGFEKPNPAFRVRGPILKEEGERNDTLSSISFSRAKPMTNGGVNGGVRINSRRSNVFS